MRFLAPAEVDQMLLQLRGLDAINRDGIPLDTSLFPAAETSGVPVAAGSIVIPVLLNAIGRSAFRLYGGGVFCPLAGERSTQLIASEVVALLRVLLQCPQWRPAINVR